MIRISILVLLTLLISQSIAKPVYDYTKSKVVRLSKLNFQNQCIKARSTSKQVHIVHFYKDNDGASFEFADQYESFADEYQGIFNIAAVDCKADVEICEKEKIAKFPTIRVYPPMPVPSFDYEGSLDTKKVMNQASKYLSNNVIEVTSANLDTFIKESPSVPKALLFTNSKGVPLIFKGLSISFEHKIFFGVVRSSEEIVMDRYGIKDVPSLLLVKTGENKPKKYNGELKFKPIFEFFNVYSEAFVAGGGSSQDTSATKAWLAEVVPQMNYLSANDICLKEEGALCVIALSHGKPESSLIDTLKNTNVKFDNKLQRGTIFKFMWLDVDTEKPWKDLFNQEQYPSIVILNPGRRKRFVSHEGSLDLESLSSTLEKINGGDAKFKAITVDLPLFEMMKQ